MKGEVEDLAKKIFTIGDKTKNVSNQSQRSKDHLGQFYFYDPPHQKSIMSRLKNVKCHRGWFLEVFPILHWLPTYEKKNLSDDVIAGLTVAVMHIPQGMAYALLGGVPPIVGIYMAFFPVLIYIVMGTSKHVSMGTFAVVCMMVGKSVDANSRPLETNATGGSQQTFSNMSLTSTEIATAVCFIVGIWQVILSILRLGCLSVLLSQTLVSGFTTGAAVHVLTSQIRNLLGIKVGRYFGPFKIIYTYIDVFQNISNLNVIAAVLSVSFISFLFISNEIIKPFLQKKFKKTIAIPTELVVVIIGTLLSQTLNMKTEFGLSVVDKIPTGLPEPSIPPLNLLAAIATDGLVIAIVAISINISMASIFATKLGYEIDANQEILASGVGNVFSSFFSCMPYAASLSRSLIQESVGGKTQIASVISCISLVFVLLFVGPFFEPLPYCVLSTIIVVALKGMFKQVGELPRICKSSKLDGLVWITAFLSVVLLDIDYGLGIGLAASLLTLLVRGQTAKVQVLGRVPGTQIYVDISRFKQSQTLANIIILRIIGGLHFANSAGVKKKIMKLFIQFSRKHSGDLIKAEKQSRCLSLVIDLSCVPFLDPSAVKCLKMLCDDVRNFETNVLFCGCVSPVYESLTNSENFNNHTNPLIFHTVQDAVEYAEDLERKNSSERVAEIILKF